MTHAMGWNPQRPDHRDLQFTDSSLGVRLPVKVDLWPHVPEIWDQGSLGSCTSHGSLRVFLTEAKRQGVGVPMLSRLMQYYDSRAIEGTASYDSGATVRDAVKVLASEGCAPESEWPYDIAQFAVKPPAACYQNARKFMSIKYQAITQGPGSPMRTALAKGLAIVFGFSVPQSFEDGSWDPATQVLPLPGPNEGFIVGHSVALTGYDFSRKDFPIPYFIADNSWGSGWGFGGRFRIAWNYFDRLATDLWVIQGVT